MLVVRRLHVAAQLVVRLEELGLEAEGGAIRFGGPRGSSCGGFPYLLSG